MPRALPFVSLTFGLLILSGCVRHQPPEEDVPVLSAPDESSEGAGPGAVDEDAPEEFTTTPSGLKYRIRRKSDGKKPILANTVVAHYRGWLDDETVFDSSYPRGEPASFPLGGVVKGWQEGLQLIGEGGMIELEIPSEMGYGEKGFPPDIPGGATLHFIVELVEVK